MSKSQYHTNTNEVRGEIYPREAAPAYVEQPPASHPAPQYSAYDPSQHSETSLSRVQDSTLVASQEHDSGTFSGGEYHISHRNSSAILKIALSQFAPFHAVPGSMMTMTSGLDLKGTLKFSFRKLASGADLSTANYTGPGEVILAPILPGDIKVIQVNQGDVWTTNTRSFLGCTQQIERKSMQSSWKDLFNSTGLFLEKTEGHGLLFVQGYGAITRITIPSGQDYIVENGHFVASNCKYGMERVGSGGRFSRILSGDGYVCRLKGPGDVYLQTRNFLEFLKFVKAHANYASTADIAMSTTATS